MIPTTMPEAFDIKCTCTSQQNFLLVDWHISMLELRFICNKNKMWQVTILVPFIYTSNNNTFNI